MAVDTASIERALGSIGTTFRLVRLYPPTHPAVIEAMRQVAVSLPGLSAAGIVEWKVGATGLHWSGQHLLPRNAQLSELAGLLFARGVRSVQVHPGVTPEQVLALFSVATGSLLPDDPSLGRIGLGVGRRTVQRLSQLRTATPLPTAAIDLEGAPAEVGAPAPPPAPSVEQAPPERGKEVFRPDALPVDVEARRVVTTLCQAGQESSQREAVSRLADLAPQLLALRDVTAIAEVIAGLDEALLRVKEPEIVDQLGGVAATLADPTTVHRMVGRLGELRVPPTEREALVKAVGALGAITVAPVLEAFLAAPPDRREPYRAAIRVAADRAIEPVIERFADADDATVAAAAEFLGLSGSPMAVDTLLELVRHRAEAVRERALLALAELGARETSRPCIPALKDDSALVRIAAARAIGVAGDVGATTVLARRLDLEEDEGVHAELLRAIGRLGAKEALEVLAKWAEPGGRPRRTSFVRAAAVEGLGLLAAGEARALLALYRQDKDPAVKRAADAALK